MPRTVIELFEDQVHYSSVRSALRFFRDGQWEDISWKDWWDRSERLAAGLIEAGVSKGDCVGILLSTRVEWVIVDMAIMMIGALSVPFLHSVPRGHLAETLNELNMAVILVEDPLQVAKVCQCGEVSALRKVYYVEADVLVSPSGGRASEFLRVEDLEVPDRLEVASIDDCSQMGRAALAEDSRFVARRRREIESDDVATIVYTAGVEGEPRAVALTQANLQAQIAALTTLHLFNERDIQLLFMPLAHTFTRVMYLGAFGSGMVTAFGRGPKHLSDDLQELRPTVLASVPRVFERMEEEIRERIEARGLRAKFLPLAVKVGRTVGKRGRRGEQPGTSLSMEHRLFSKLLLGDVRSFLGGSIRFLISGAAPLKVSTGEFFAASGVLLLEGYGLTETSGVVSLNLPDDLRMGSVGKPIPGVDVTIAEDGEILIRGTTIASRYIHSGASLDIVGDDNWLHTGDLGYFDSDGFLFLQDRKVDRIITSTGRHILPGPIEAKLTRSPLIQRAILIGDARPFLSVLVFLDSRGLLAFLGSEAGEGKQSLDEILDDGPLRAELNRCVDVVNSEQPTDERILALRVIPDFRHQTSRREEPEVFNRRTTIARYQDLIEEIYNQER